jgi:hypothetical protein
MEYAVAPKGSALRLVASLALAVGLLVLVPAAAAARSGGATVFTHSAKSGELRGNLLTLRGVGSRLTWAHNSGRTGSVSVARLHRRLFSPEAPPVGTLHVAGRRGGRGRAFRLTRPRYNPAREWVRYRVERLGRRPRASQASGTDRFGAASLSIVGHPSRIGISTSGGNYCAVGILNLTIHDLQATSATKWDTDDWDPGNPFNAVVENLGGTESWATDGGFLRGCSNTVVWALGSDPRVSFRITTTHPFKGNVIETCKPSDSSYTCSQTLGIDEVNWVVRPVL